MSETVIKNRLRDVLCECGNWSECYEPRRGSGTGIPDLHTLIRSVLIPVEVKEGLVTNTGWAAPKPWLFVTGEVRPAQISWHERYATAGGVSYIFVGNMDGNGWLLPSVRFEFLKDWREGWELERCKQVMKEWKMINMQYFRLPVLGNE